MTTKERVHQMIDELAEEDLKAIAEYLGRLQATEDRLERSLLRASILEPEELSPEDKDTIHEAEKDVADGRVMSHAELLRRLGHAG